MIKFYDPIYRYTYYFDANDYLKAQKKIFKEVIAQGEAKGWFFMKDGKILISIKGFNKSNKKISTLYHEVNHAVDYVFENNGIEDSEARSYYGEFITRTILDEYSKKTSRTNKKVSGVKKGKGTKEIKR